jgi:apolipoprotein N-acyltransferase
VKVSDPKLGATLASSAVAGGFFALASPPTNLYAALWLGMAALAFVLDREALPPKRWPRAGRALEGGLRGLAFGIGANVIALRFVPEVVARFTPIPWAGGCVLLFLLACEQGVRWAVAGILTRLLARRGVPPWLAFGAGIYAGTFVPAVFPWSAAGGVTPVPAMVQLAELVGERGVTLLMAFSAGLLASSVQAFREKRATAAWLALGAAFALPLLTFLEGSLRIARIEESRGTAPTVTIGLVQPATAALERWDPTRAGAILDRLTALTLSSERRGAEITVWPEAAYPFPLPHGTRYCPIGARAILPIGVRGPVLAGMVMTGANGDLYNSAAICQTRGTMTPSYDKLRLLWFGETIPVIDRIPFIRKAFSRGTGMVPGSANVMQVAGAVRASILNCFEDTLPDAGREAMADRPNLLINITNDAWFAGSAESELHLRLGVLRAVESRRDFVRAVNLGPTTWVDAAGIVAGRYASPLAGVLVATPALLEWEPTLFDRLGDAPTALALLAWTFARARHKKRDPTKS